MALPARRLYRGTDILDSPDDGTIWEVLDGELFIMPAPGEPHQRAQIRLSYFLFGYVWDHGLGEVYNAPIGVLLTPDDRDGVQPDVVYVSNERRHLIQPRGIFGAPDLVVEVVSPSNEDYDRGKKLARYAVAGVPHVWFADPTARTLETLRLGPDGYVVTGRYGPGDVLRPELFPGLAIPIDRIWA